MFTFSEEAVQVGLPQLRIPHLRLIVRLLKLAPSCTNFDCFDGSLGGKDVFRRVRANDHFLHIA